MWKDFIVADTNVLAGVDFFTVEVLTWQGLATYYELFFLHLENRRVKVAGITRHPDQEWMEQIAPQSNAGELGTLGGMPLCSGMTATRNSAFGRRSRDAACNRSR
jgi:putative transposase